MCMVSQGGQGQELAIHPAHGCKHVCYLGLSAPCKILGVQCCLIYSVHSIDVCYVLLQFLFVCSTLHTYIYIYVHAYIYIYYAVRVIVYVHSAVLYVFWCALLYLVFCQCRASIAGLSASTTCQNMWCWSRELQGLWMCTWLFCVLNPPLFYLSIFLAA